MTEHATPQLFLPIATFYKNDGSIPINMRAVRYIFEGDPETLSPLPILGAVPPAFSAYIMREYRAADIGYHFLQKGQYVLPDPWSDKLVCSRVSTTISFRNGLPYEMLPIVYCFRNAMGAPFWAICYSASGRITQLVLPDAGVVLYEGNLAAARRVVTAVSKDVEECFTSFSQISERKAHGQVVILMDLLHNFGHQLVNHLPVYERLRRSNLEDACKEVWTSGLQFFSGLVEKMDGAKHVHRTFRSRWDVNRAATASPNLLVKLGSNVFTSTLRSTIIKNALEQGYAIPAYKRAPLFYVNLRCGGRRCRNLPDVIVSVSEQLLSRIPNLGIVLDGWVRPDAPDEMRAKPWLEELEMAISVQQRLPRGAVVSVLIGKPISQSILALLDADCYLSHVGTLQHKVAFFARCQGIVHGPRRQLTQIDSGHYMAEALPQPIFVPPELVIDIGTDTERGEGFFDYEITDIGWIVETATTILTGAQAG